MKKLLGCLLVLFVCLWVIYRTTILAVHYEKLVGSLQWESDRCIHKQGLDPKGRLGSTGLYSRFSIQSYPVGLCTIGPAVFEHSPRIFTTRAPSEQKDKLSTRLSSLLWPVSVTTDPWPECTHYHDEAFVFTMSNPSTEGWYYSLHMSTFLPLYSLISYRSHMGPHSDNGYSLVLMPAVENYELQTVDWSSDVFDEEQRFGVLQQMLSTFAGSMQVTALTIPSLHAGDTTCFMNVHFGVGTVNMSDPALLRGFSLMMMARLGLPHPQVLPTEPSICLAKRSLNGRVLNDEELVEAVRGFVKIQVVQFDGLSYREQVSQMQRYTVLVGFHGDELLNAIYMPKDSVTIQLLPFEPEGLRPDKYSDIVRSHGPYLEWTNSIEENSRPSDGFHGDDSQVDTVVDVDEFVELVSKALKLGINRKLVTL